MAVNQYPSDSSDLSHSLVYSCRIPTALMVILQRPRTATWATCRIPRILYRRAEGPADTIGFSTDIFCPLLQAAPVMLQILNESGCQLGAASPTACAP